MRPLIIVVALLAAIVPTAAPAEAPPPGEAAQPAAAPPSEAAPAAEPAASAAPAESAAAEPGADASKQAAASEGAPTDGATATTTPAETESPAATPTETATATPAAAEGAAAPATPAAAEGAAAATTAAGAAAAPAAADGASTTPAAAEGAATAVPPPAPAAETATPAADAAAAVAAATSEPEAGARRLPLPRWGIAIGAGFPDFANASLMFRPWRALRLYAGPAWNYFAWGVQGGVAVAPWNWWITPVLSLEAGKFRPSNLGSLIDDDDEDAAQVKPLVERVDYSYAALDLGFEIGSPRGFALALRFGLSHVNIGAKGTGSSSEDDGSSVSLRDPKFRGTLGSAKLDLQYWF
jgi:hypothetical protein